MPKLLDLARWGVFASMGLMSLVPTPSEPGSILFIVSFSVYALILMWQNRQSLSPRSMGILTSISSRLIAFLLAVFMLSGLIGIIDGRTLELVGRGLAPHICMASFYIFLLDEELDADKLRSLIFLIFWLWLLKGIYTITHDEKAMILIGIGGRLTGGDPNFALPFQLLTFCLSFRLRGLKSLLYASVSTLVIVLCGYRGLYLLCPVAWITWCLMVDWKLLVRGAVIGLIGFVLISGLSLGSNSEVDFVGVFLEKQGQRLSRLQDEGESGRSMEIQYTLGKFVDSPIWGYGISASIPAEITYHSDLEFLDDVLIDSVTYCHNVTAYFLYDFGLLGWIPLVLLYLEAAASTWKSNLDQEQVCWFLALSAWVLFFHTEASFRAIQVNVLLGGMFYMLERLKLSKPEAEPTPENEVSAALPLAS